MDGCYRDKGNHGQIMKAIPVAGRIFLLDFEGAVLPGKVDLLIKDAGYIPANRSIAIPMLRQSPELQHTNAIVVLGEKGSLDEKGTVLVFPMIGDGLASRTDFHREGVHVLESGKWEEHARFLVHKPMTPPHIVKGFASFFGRLRESFSRQPTPEPA